MGILVAVIAFALALLVFKLIGAGLFHGLLAIEEGAQRRSPFGRWTEFNNPQELAYTAEERMRAARDGTTLPTKKNGTRQEAYNLFTELFVKDLEKELDAINYDFFYTSKGFEFICLKDEFIRDRSDFLFRIGWQCGPLKFYTPVYWGCYRTSVGNSFFLDQYLKYQNQTPEDQDMPFDYGDLTEVLKHEKKDFFKELFLQIYQGNKALRDQIPA